MKFIAINSVTRESWSNHEQLAEPLIRLESISIGNEGIRKKQLVLRETR